MEHEAALQEISRLKISLQELAAAKMVEPLVTMETHEQTCKEIRYRISISACRDWESQYIYTPPGMKFE
jgi:hypothetical protein